jgi:hypothetical protein
MKPEVLGLEAADANAIEVDFGWVECIAVYVRFEAFMMNKCSKIFHD